MSNLEKRFIADIRRIMHDAVRGKAGNLAWRFLKLSESARKKGLEMRFGFHKSHVYFYVGDEETEGYYLSPDDRNVFEFFAEGQEGIEVMDSSESDDSSVSSGTE